MASTSNKEGAQGMEKVFETFFEKSWQSHPNVPHCVVESQGETKSFKDIKTGVLFKIHTGRLVETKFGPRVVVTLEEITSYGLSGVKEERWAFHRLEQHFVTVEEKVNSRGVAYKEVFLKDEEYFPRVIGFKKTIKTNPTYVFGVEESEATKALKSTPKTTTDDSVLICAESDDDEHWASPPKKRSKGGPGKKTTTKKM